MPGRCRGCADSYNRSYSGTPGYVDSYSHGNYNRAGGYPTRCSPHGGIHEGQIVDEEPTPVRYGERRVRKLVDVPVTREVKVPTVVERVVESTEVKEFPVTRVRQEQAYRTVHEDYVDYEEREQTRMKEIWVKQQVPETFVERVPVTRTRSVDVPYTKTREYTDVERIEVPVTRVVEEPGYRVDEIIEYETREVEGKQRVEWIPHVVDEVVDERDLGVRDRRVVDRRMGHTIYPEHGGMGYAHGHAHPSSTVHPDPYTGGRAGHAYPSSSVHNDPYTGGRASCPPTGHHPAPRPCGDSQFGLAVKESVIGLVVKAVEPCSRAEEAGIGAGDVIQTVDGMEVFSVEEWRRAVTRKRAVTVAYRSKRLGRNMKTLLSY